ncbi:endonuclease/exonuclease/phosphatase family protein [Streptomyces tsukubensis]|uniref:Endonuclease n=1 Tax=Streptomyces tsukubensis (strain DSM 42081 / NBRC 108919 / NRRL 18488 / 9993) TaxID=1114943 RepID=A0A7G3UAK0_STRT9|nr:endonuclease/exonuclease/phosphatase family protein [Streptomyces tsukubensis]AZK97491.1 endonuclease [Streptomyces tsukubensis]QKM66561.1 endonuclease [Streptomyces tsukubensis NRRL18488]TAI45096.1 endonuclease/exonuclease/phosphatase family protein [Streptomyces tsukubensis]
MTPDGTAPEAAARQRRSRHSGRRLRARAVLVLAPLLALVSLYPDPVPNAGPRLGSLLETFQPWLPLAALPLAAVALWRRSALALAACALPGAAWLIAHGGALLADEDTPYDLTALQHNVSDVNPDPAGTARQLAGAGADLIALEEVVPAALPAYREILSPGYPHLAVEGTVALWSRHPLTDIRPVDIRPQDVPRDWRRGLRATAHTPKGEIAVYVAHLPSVRMSPASGFGTARRDESARYLGRAIEAEETERVLLMGDLNSTVADRGLAPVTSQLNAPAGTLAFSWPASLPLARIDQVLARNAKVAHIRALDRTGSDHLPVLARIRF